MARFMRRMGSIHQTRMSTAVVRAAAATATSRMTLRISPNSVLQLDDDGHVVGGLLHVARVAVGLDALEAVGGLGREQVEVDADAVVTLPGAGLIVPEG